MTGFQTAEKAVFLRHYPKKGSSLLLLFVRQNSVVLQNHVLNAEDKHVHRIFSRFEVLYHRRNHQ